MVQVLWCRYQLAVDGKRYNELLLKAEVFTALYEEIERVLPSLEYCLAPRKKKQSVGASALRSAVDYEEPTPVKTPEELNEHAKIVYEWLDRNKKSAYLLCPIYNIFFFDD